MKKFNGYALVSDFDGTLINRNGKISKENIDAIEYFIEHGGLFCGATGRTHLGIKSYEGMLPVVAPWILYNGAGIYDIEKGAFLYEERISPKELCPIINGVIEKLPLINAVVFTNEMLYFVNDHAVIDDEILENIEHKNYKAENIEAPWMKIMFSGRPDTLKEVEAILEKTLDQETYRYFYSGKYYLEVMGKDVSKGTGLKALKKYLPENIQYICAIGDYYNDVEMLQWADYSAAPDNAPDDIKSHATVVVNHHDQHAVKDFVEWLEERV